VSGDLIVHEVVERLPVKRRLSSVHHPVSDFTPDRLPASSPRGEPRRQEPRGSRRNRGSSIHAEPDEPFRRSFGRSSSPQCVPMRDREERGRPPTALGANGRSFPPAGTKRLPRAVIALGFASLFTDVSSEMIFPLLPVFLTAALGASPQFLGLVEGAADTVSSLLKLGSGYLADPLPRRKPLVVAGYGIATAARPLVAVATAPWQVLAIRLSDRFGKGVRSAPRDAMIADAAPPGQAGRALGFHRAMDHAGAVIGPLVATVLLSRGLDLRTVFWLAAVPGVASVVMVLLAPERSEHRSSTTERVRVPPPPLPSRLRTYLGILLVFAVSNSSDAFLLLRAHDLGVANALLPTLWAVFHVSKLLSSYFGGSFADRVPRTRMIIAGWVVYAAVYLGLGVARGSAAVWGLFIVYGTYYGLSEPAAKALGKDLSTAENRGRAFGYYNFVLGATALPASLLTGSLWRALGPRTALLAGAGLAGLAALALAWWGVRARASARS